MLMVNASAQPSTIHGIGLLANEKIPKGTVTWKFNPQFDILFDPEEVQKMSDYQKKLLDTYSYLSKTSGKYVYSIDDSRFTNHSATEHNIDSVFISGEEEGVGVANRDIEVGEELLVDYRAFDAHDETSNEEYLRN